jgi:hypothetical protein
MYEHLHWVTLSAVNILIPFLLLTCSRRPPCFLCPLLAHKHTDSNLPCRDLRRVCIHRYQHYKLCRGASTKRRLQVNTESHQPRGGAGYEDGTGRPCALHVLGRHAPLTPCVQQRTQSCQSSVVNHGSFTLFPSLPLWFLFSNAISNGAAVLHTVTMSVVAPVQQGSFRYRLPVASFTSFCCCKTYAVHALTGFVRYRCKRLAVYLQLCVGQSGALFCSKLVYFPARMFQYISRNCRLQHS